MNAMLWMAGALFSFSLMAIGGRELADTLSVTQILFFRSLIGLAFALILLRLGRQFQHLRQTRYSLHLWRNTCHIVGQYCWFWGITVLPLAEVFALEFTVPIWTLIIAALFLGETISTRKIAAIVLGLTGVLWIVRPGLQGFSADSLIVLVSAIAYAASHSITKALSGSTHPSIILFYMCAIQLPITFVVALFDWDWPMGLDWIWLLIVGITALGAHYCIAKAMKTAEASAVVVMDFLRLPLIAAAGWLLYDETLEMAVLIGALFMLGANLVRTERKRTMR